LHRLKGYQDVESNAILEHESNPKINFTPAKSRRQRFSSPVDPPTACPLMEPSLTILERHHIIRPSAAEKTGEVWALRPGGCYAHVQFPGEGKRPDVSSG
jgi:hypothetical protein